jgi:hypothetical protein
MLSLSPGFLLVTKLESGFCKLLSQDPKATRRTYLPYETDVFGLIHNSTNLIKIGTFKENPCKNRHWFKHYNLQPTMTASIPM